jgi:hypothetical protein
MGARIRGCDRCAARMHERGVLAQGQRRLGGVEGAQKERHDTAVFE